jgi:hypothetical protein
MGQDHPVCDGWVTAALHPLATKLLHDGAAAVSLAGQELSWSAKAPIESMTFLVLAPWGQYHIFDWKRPVLMIFPEVAAQRPSKGDSPGRASFEARTSG